MEKNKFDSWNIRKKTIHEKIEYPHMTEGEVWWCGIGQNVGVEINGKSEFFSRPIVVYKKLSATSFLGVPLSTKKHTGSWYVPFNFLDKQSIAVLSQIRIISVKRLYRRMGQLDESDFRKIKESFKKLYF